MFKFLRKRAPHPLNPKEILGILDQAADAFVFPMLDNGYIYLVAARLSLFRSNADWAVVFEISGYSPRAGEPDLSVITISSKLHDRKTQADYATKQAYENYLRNNPFWENECYWPISNDDWMDPENPEFVAQHGTIILRDQSMALPNPDTYASRDILLTAEQPAVFELCRHLAHDHRDALLATEAERRAHLHPEMEQIMLLDAWHHPDLAGNQMPSQTETFRQIAQVLAKRDPSLLSTAEPENTHWKNWPAGGTL